MIRAGFPAPPSEALGPLFRAVQMARLFPDSKTFADATPKAPPSVVLADFTARAPSDPDALRRFVMRWFDLPVPAAPFGPTPEDRPSLARHIERLWPSLVREAKRVPDGSSLIVLPRPYLVPGGRFGELYYWDTYFSVIGLSGPDRPALIEGVIEDFGALIERFGHIPNGSRSYYLGRSQPPVFALLLALSADDGRVSLERRTAWLEAEHRFWMSGGRRVRLADGSNLNRYWDDRPAPRDEAFHEDVLLAEANPGRAPTELWRDLRAASESGWDFSARWLADETSLASIRTTRWLPIDLNVLLLLMERALESRHRRLGDAARADDWRATAEARERAIHAHFWNGRFFADHDLDAGHAAERLTAAAAWPLYARIASPAAARTTATALETLIGPGGIASTAVRGGQQWDAPNGWAPLQWIAWNGLRNYGAAALAERIRAGWIATVEREYRSSGRLLEKYDVLEQKAGGGGEYPTQDGFGWTNGVTARMLRTDP